MEKLSATLGKDVPAITSAIVPTIRWDQLKMLRLKIQQLILNAYNSNRRCYIKETITGSARCGQRDILLWASDKEYEHLEKSALAKCILLESRDLFSFHGYCALHMQ